MTIIELYDLIASEPNAWAVIAYIATWGAAMFSLLSVLVDFFATAVKSLWRRWREKRKADKS